MSFIKAKNYEPRKIRFPGLKYYLFPANVVAIKQYMNYGIIAEKILEQLFQKQKT